MNILQFIEEFAGRLDAVWTFLLLVTRYTGFIAQVPGLGEGFRGLTIRFPAVLVFAFASMQQGTYAAVPDDWALMLAMLAGEFMFGVVLGLLPTMIISGVQTAGQLASTSMGLGAGQLFDPSIGGAQSDLGRLFGDLTIIVFLLIGGHHVAVMAASGLGGQVVPGSFFAGEITAQLLIERSGDIFRMAVMLSAPVIVALLLTQFVMGLVSKAVPTVNIFIVSFPLTIAIGLLISIIALPDIITFVKREFTGLENSMMVVVDQAQQAP